MSSPAEAEDLDGARRSGRKRKSTIIQIDGHAVLAKNNYILKGGKYEIGVFDADVQKPKTKAAPKKKGSSANPVVRKQKPSEIARVEHNENVKAGVLEKQSVRRDFMLQHYDTLKPFMDDSTRRMVQSWRDSTTPYQRDELFFQPALITGGEMRDYQLAGLNFMVDMHRQNLGMILGDEMGL